MKRSQVAKTLGKFNTIGGTTKGKALSLEGILPKKEEKVIVPGAE